jgi:hypothetical protein|tara:strand:- start:1013 stop:1306 length:294 start_codon:yes stop_codon:yes gene_type:complete
MYNLTILSDSDSIGDLFITANTYSNSTLFGMFIIAIFFVMLMVLKKWEFTSALLTSSFSSFILSLILVYADLLNFIYPLLFLTITAFTALYVFTAQR